MIEIETNTHASIKAWVDGVVLEESAKKQLLNTAQLPIVHSHIAVMPDVHWGRGSTVGSVIPTVKAVIPAAVGVDIGCGMAAVKTSLRASDLPETLRGMRKMIEQAVPHGRTGHGKRRRDKGSWGNIPTRVGNLWNSNLQQQFDQLAERYPVIQKANHLNHLGTLGTGNHFIEVCLDEAQQVWVMLHSGSRGIGNRIATIFIERAKREMENQLGDLPDEDLAYLKEGSPFFEDYIAGVDWAQEYARINRQVMLENVIKAMEKTRGLPRFKANLVAVNCHHNYISREVHGGEELFITRKGAVSARAGELGIIPGSMGAKSYIVRGKGNRDAYCSCSHGAGRAMSRTKAKKLFSLDDHIHATEGVECRKDLDVIDETPMAYKDIDVVMAAQKDLVEVVHTLKQVVCVKG
ncbi:MAG: RtcB family protein [Gammaproteobacteria bacterium]|jgi:tRNA-splicing ligase RtcB|nr:RtcB family protein [Gammaproteobacteria bacterium]MBT4812556.1 RtcB family protein [Thiotrichales bacterium]MBT5372851.1 RtcB family protein [Gammaproteobacteria bacterium]MBT5744744.1 RtcB family protein [Gammaproteobacteria bacterium]MBT6479757.1 RtcB family protein [Gammaproteobacteria bacterium]